MHCVYAVVTTGLFPQLAVKSLDLLLEILDDVVVLGQMVRDVRDIAPHLSTAHRINTHHIYKRTCKLVKGLSHKR